MKNDDMPVLMTERLRLEPFKRSHFEQLHYLNTDREVMRYIADRKITIDETLQHMDLVIRNWRELGYSSWCIFKLDDGEFIGSCGIQHIDFKPENPVEFGWRFKVSHWGKGYASEAATRMMRFVFEQTEIDYLHAVCHPENIASERVMQRVGMHYRGIESWYGLDTKVYTINRDQYFTEISPVDTLIPGSLIPSLRATNSSLYGT